MLKNDFYNIIETNTNDTENDSLVVKVELAKDHSIYEGHFPGNPVVPGVCLIQIIKELVEIKTERSISLKKGDNIKFLNFVNPVANPILFFNLSIKTLDQLHVKATILFEEKIFLKFSGSFA